ncbi:MAG: hypothetical protein GX282_06240 [Campylobacteraceae bacterium]|nr:hypothetical protein [Campylobacteraceae bacterium]
MINKTNNIFEKILYALSICIGVVVGIFSIFAVAYIVDAYSKPSIEEEYSFNLTEINFKENPILSPYVYVNSKNGFSDLLLFVSFETGNVVRLNYEKDIGVVYSMKIKDYKTNEVIYDLENIYSEIHLPGSKNFGVQLEPHFNNISLENKKYIFDLKYYQTNNVDVIYHYNGIMNPKYRKYEYKLFDILMSV